MSNLSKQEVRDAMLAEYREVAQNFRELTEIRFKLLGILPIATAFAAFSSSWSNGEIGVPLSIFGLAVTLGLIVYNERNNQLYDELVQRAAQLERRLGLYDGHFSQRPAAWLKIHPLPGTSDGEFAVPIQHDCAIGIIYRASIAAWLFMLFSPIFTWIGDKVLSRAAFDVSMAGHLSTLVAIITAVCVGESFFNWFKSQKRDRRKSMRALATEAVSGLEALKFPPDLTESEKWDKLFSRAMRLRGGEPEEEFNTILPLARFYLSNKLTRSRGNIYYPLPSSKSSCDFGPITAAHVIALLTDLPARWLLDIRFGRRGSRDENKQETDKLLREARTRCQSIGTEHRIRKWLQENETHQTSSQSSEGSQHSSGSCSL